MKTEITNIHLHLDSEDMRLLNELRNTYPVRTDRKYARVLRDAIRCLHAQRLGEAGKPGEKKQ